jgi:hypothetical protein
MKLIALIVFLALHIFGNAQDFSRAEKSDLIKTNDVTNDCFEKSKCPYFFDLYKNNKFRKILHNSLLKEKIQVFKWIQAGVSSPAVPIVIRAKKQLYLSTCKPHDCSSNHIDLIYNEKYDQIKGLLKLDDQTFIIGFFDDDELEVLVREVNRYSDSTNLNELAEKNIRKKIIAAGCQGLADVPIGLQMRALKDCEENRSADFGR